MKTARTFFTKLIQKILSTENYTINRKKYKIFSWNKPHSNTKKNHSIKSRLRKNCFVKFKHFLWLISEFSPILLDNDHQHDYGRSIRSVLYRIFHLRGSFNASRTSDQSSIVLVQIEILQITCLEFS